MLLLNVEALLPLSGLDQVQWKNKTSRLSDIMDSDDLGSFTIFDRTCETKNTKHVSNLYGELLFYNTDIRAGYHSKKKSQEDNFDAGSLTTGWFFLLLLFELIQNLARVFRSRLYNVRANRLRL